jgi:hypothetical protein
MSVYSNGNVKTKLLEPSTYNENVSCEFRLTEPCLPNIRLIDVGSKANANTSYNKLLGAYGVLKSVFLYSGQLLLDGTPNIQNFMAFKKYNKENSVNRSLNKFLVRNQMGFVMGADQVLSDGSPATNNQAGSTDNATSLSWVSVADYCPLLNKLNVLDPAVFKNLRLVLEFDTDRQGFLNRSDRTSHNTRRPRLIYDALEAGSFNPNPSMISWNTIEQDRFQVSAMGVGAVSTQTTTAKLNGFNSKLLGRILMCKTPSNDADNNDGAGAINGFGRYRSQAGLDEKIQVVVNGVQQLPRNGVEGANRQLSMLHDAWGVCNTLPGGNTQGLTRGGLKSAQLNQYDGQQSYFGCFINQRVKDLQITYTRTGDIDNRARPVANLGLNCLVYGEVSKSLMIKGGEVNVVYN